MNDIQRQKALEAVSASNLIDVEELEKAHALDVHLWAMQNVDVYNLPYGILKAYFKEYGLYLKGYEAACKDGIVLINPLYPKPGYYQADLVGVDWYIDKHYTINPLIRIVPGPFKDDLTSSKFDLRTFIQEDTELSQRIEAKAAEQITWNLKTAAGRKKWEYEFAHFLNAADLENYSCFDWWGKKQAPNEAEERINYWKSLQADYYKHPENYRQEEPTCDSPELFTLCKFYWNYQAFDKYRDMEM